MSEVKKRILEIVKGHAGNHNEPQDLYVPEHAFDSLADAIIERINDEDVFIEKMINELPQYGIDTSRWEYDYGDCCYGGAIEFLSKVIKGEIPISEMQDEAPEIDKSLESAEEILSGLESTAIMRSMGFEFPIYTKENVLNAMEEFADQFKKKQYEKTDMKNCFEAGRDYQYGERNEYDGGKDNKHPSFDEYIKIIR